MELAPHQIAVNAIRAGVTDTPALRKIPGNERLIQKMLENNPHHRLTDVQDVASAIGMLALTESCWLTGNIICVDGGEFIVS
ncbi:Enoyl-[acyl-carrier-protein] reductase [NADPH] FabL [compost metagenome]